MSDKISPETEIPETDLREVTAKNIATLRTSNKMTQLELGAALSYSDKAISKWERGESVPDAYVLLDLSRLFGVSVDWILNPHTEEEALPKASPKHFRPHLAVTLLSFFGIWALATVIFVITAIMHEPLWQIFIYALPPAVVVLLVFSALWGHPRRIHTLVALLLPSIVLTIYIAALPRNLWQLFLLLPPSELLVLLSRLLLWRK